MKPSARRALQLIAFATLFTTFGAAAVHAQSITAAPDGTGTRVNQSGNQFDITGGTRSGANLYQSFQQFGLNQGQIANFLSNPNIQNILGRVTGGDASVINGLIKVTGGNSNLFLMNPAGIVFGPNASLNVPAAFTATTANAIGVGTGWFNAVGSNDYAALTGTPNSFAFLGQAGSIVNAGNLSVGQGQSVTLLGGTVINTGTLAAPGGTVTVAAVPGGKLVRLSQSGSLLSVDLPVASQSAINPATATPLSLPQLLTGTVSTVATGVTVENGIVKLTASSTPIPTAAGTAIVAGTLTTAGTNPATINVLGDKVGLIAATLDASGTSGGGTILVGGDYQGQGTVPKAQSTYVSPDSVLKADALTSGKGGKVIVWADGNTRFQGTISAKGGAQGGDGGLVETSGKTTLAVKGGQVDASAPKGQAGTWLLDPTDINISNSGTGTLTAGLFDPPANNNIAPATIQAALDSGTNVSLTTASGTGGSGDITLSDSINQTGGGGAALTLTGRRFERVGSATISMTSNGGLTFNLNQVNPETNVPSSVVQSAINAIGAVAGTRTINLGAGTYSGATLLLTKALTLNGMGASSTTLSGNDTYRVLSINTDSTVNLSGLLITKGLDNTGAGIFKKGSGTLNITNSTIAGNLAPGNETITGGGGIFTTDGTVNVSNSTITSNVAGGGGNGGGIYIYLRGGTVNVTNSTISSNVADGSGGGIFSDSLSTLNITNSTIVGNTTAGYGSGVSSNGVLTVSNSTIAGNAAARFGGGISILDNVTGSVATVSNSTITGNTAGGTNGSGSVSGGGGIYVDSDNGAQLTVSNSTIANNVATGGSGGGIGGESSNGNLSINVSNSTISGNAASTSGGGIAVSGRINISRINISNSIVAGNLAPSGREAAGGLTSGGYNLFGFSRDSGLDPVIMLAATDRVPTVPLSSILTPLGNYGGSTNTLALLPGSPAINAGNPATTTVDQRGVAPVGTRDIGAYESKGFALTSSGTTQSVPVNTAFAPPITMTLTETAFNRPLPGTSLTFVVPNSGASAVFDSTTLKTDANGQVRITATANSNPGTYQISVVSNGVTLGTFSLTNTGGQTGQPAQTGVVAETRLPTQVERDLQSKPIRQQVVAPTVEKAVLCVARSQEPTNLDAYQGVPTCNRK